MSFTPAYHVALFGDKDAYIRGQYQYHSHNGGAFAGGNPNSITYDPNIPLPPATSLLNLRAGLSWSGIDASVFVNNALNSHPSLRLSHPLGGDPLYSNLTFRPLTAGLTLVYRY